MRAAIAHSQRAHVLEVSSIADCFDRYDEWAGRLDPNEYNPLIGLRGGESFVTSVEHEVDALLLGNTWINLCREYSGADTVHALLCLAMNYDTSPGLVACVLEVALLAKKPTTHESIRITHEAFRRLVSLLYGNNCAALYTLMKGKWGEKKEGLVLPPPLKTRSIWREELGFDVLIHPKTLEPCRDIDGSILVYEGLLIEPSGNLLKLFYVGASRRVREPIFVPNFPPVA